MCVMIFLFRKAARPLWFSLMLLLAVLAGCRVVEPVRYVDPADLLTGYFQIEQQQRNRKLPATVIPVLKIDEMYYSVCRGFEVPFKAGPGGLEWAMEGSSMKGTTIGCRPGGEYFIVIRDSQSEMFTMDSEGEHDTGPRPMRRIDKPASVLDPTAPAPRSNDDFAGCYQPRWFPYYRITIRKEGEKYLADAIIMEEKDRWRQDSKTVELAPFSDRLGFDNFDQRHTIEYNGQLKRYEMVKSTTPPIRMPLVRIDPSASSIDWHTPVIGIPSWH